MNLIINDYILTELIPLFPKTIRAVHFEGFWNQSLFVTFTSFDSVQGV